MLWLYMVVKVLIYKEDVIMLREEKLKRILGNETIEE